MNFPNLQTDSCPSLIARIQRILKFLQERIAKRDDPRSLGKALQGATFGELWRYRVGDFRIICKIQDEKLMVLVIQIGHRKDVYR